MPKKWPVLRSMVDKSYSIFSIRTDTARSPRTEREHDFYVLDTSDWVSVIPITGDHKVVMVKQYRHGTREVTLETPGGLMELGDNPEAAVRRELLEETGYQSSEYSKIGFLHPHPALFNNRLHIFSALDVKKVSEGNQDDAEDIEVVLVPLAEIPDLITEGIITHALVVAGFYYYFLKTKAEKLKEI